MSTVKSKKLQVGTDASASNNFTIYQPAVPDGTLRIGVGNADSPTEVGRFTSTGYKPAVAPAFSAHKSTAQSVSSSTWTKVTFDVEDFDTNNNFASSTFTPTVAGYYQINAVAFITGGAFCTVAAVAIYKNGSIYLREGGFSYSSAIINGGFPTISYVIYMNGTTDYLEVYGYNQCASSPSINVNTTFSGHLIQQA